MNISTLPLPDYYSPQSLSISLGVFAFLKGDSPSQVIGRPNWRNSFFVWEWVDCVLWSWHSSNPETQHIYYVQWTEGIVTHGRGLCAVQSRCNNTREDFIHLTYRASLSQCQAATFSSLLPAKAMSALQVIDTELKTFRADAVHKTNCVGLSFGPEYIQKLRTKFIKSLYKD